MPGSAPGIASRLHPITVSAWPSDAKTTARRRSSGRPTRVGSSRPSSHGSGAISRRRAGFRSRPTRSCGSGRSPSWRSSGARCGSSSTCRPTATRRPSSTTRRLPGARWFPDVRLSYVEHVFRDRDDDEVAVRHASELRPLDEWTWRDLRDHDRPHPRRPAAARRRPRRRGRGLPAEHRRGARRLLRDRLARRGLVVLLARLRRPERGRPVRPDRAGRAPRGRRLPLRRQGPRPPRRGGRDRAPRCRRCARP